MLYKLLTHIKRQPRSVRDKYAFSGAVTFTTFIALVWLVQFQPFLHQGQTAAVSQQEEVQERENTYSQPFSNLFRLFRQPRSETSTSTETSNSLDELQTAIRESVEAFSVDEEVVVEDQEIETDEEDDSEDMSETEENTNEEGESLTE